MGKRKVAKKSEANQEAADANIRVYPRSRELVNKVAGSRGESAADLMASKEMTQFLHHLMRAATDQVTGSPPAEG